MNIKKILLIGLLLFSPLICFSGNLPTTNTRGRILYPASEPAIDCTVYIKYYIINQFGQRVLVDGASPAITDYSGMYYFYNIIPREYVMHVVYRNTLIGVYNINVMYMPNQRGVFFDIPPIRVNYPR